MFWGPEQLKSTNLPPVAIVGSGPAGLTIGAALADLKIPSLILEAGDEDYDHDVQADYQGEQTGDTYFELDATRLRQFGGSSNHWSGWCRSLDKWDFEPIPNLQVPGWPIGWSDLEPFAERTREILEIEEVFDGHISDDLFEAQFLRSPPVVFSEKYESRIRTSPYLNVALRTPLLAMIAENGRIRELSVLDANGEPFALTPSIVVLACGGIENSRLLMWSNEVSPQKVVADAQTLGKYWLEHPHEDVGSAFLNRAIHVNPNGPFGVFSIGINPERLQQFGALNAAVRIPYYEPAKSLKRKMERRLCTFDPELLDVANSIAGTDAWCGRLNVKIVWEQAPDASNRIDLSDTQRDRFGIPRPHLFWRKTQQDYHTAKVAFELVGRHLLRTGDGLLKADRHLIEMGNYPDTSELAGNHHMGGTRMSTNSKQGIVDPNLKIHGISNGYVAGSSVFVRGGHANPTFTIVQLSLRLAEHLSSIIDR